MALGPRLPLVRKKTMLNLQLMRGDLVLGRMLDVEWEMFWCTARFEPSEAFASYKPMFDEECQALQSNDMATVDRLQGLFAEWNLRLVDEAGEEDDITRFGLHIHGNEADIRPVFGAA